MNRVRILSETDIQKFAEDTLSRYRQMDGGSSLKPISAEKVAMHLENVFIEWESLGADDSVRLGMAVSASWGRAPRIVLNSDYLAEYFEAIPNLENTVIGHELGHLLLHFDRGKQYQMDLGLDGIEGIAVTANSIIQSDRIPTSDDLWREWQANTFMRHLLLPASQLRTATERMSIRSWSDVGELAKAFCVTKTVMKIQLEKSQIIPRGMLADYFAPRSTDR